MRLTNRKPGRPRKAVVAVAAPIAPSRSTIEPLVAQLETLPDGTTRLPDVLRLTEYAGELLRIADKLRIFDAQARRGAIQGLPRNFLLRAQNVSAYIYNQADTVPEYPAQIR